jgi:hypothetical protein
MQKLVTEAQLRSAISTYGIRRWCLRRCSMCNAPLFYYFEGDVVSFDSACDCTRFSSPPQLRSYADVLECFNRQTAQIRAEMWADFIAAGRALEGDCFG